MPFLNAFSIIKQYRSEFITLSVAFYGLFALGLIVTAIILERKNAFAFLYSVLMAIKHNVASGRKTRSKVR